MTCYKVFINGRLVADPELKSSEGGTDYVNFTVAIDNRSKGNEKKEATFRDAIAFGYTAKYIAEKMSKGDGAIFLGREQDEKFEYVDRQGVKKSGVKAKVFVESVEGNVAGRKYKSKEDTSSGNAVPF